MLRLFIHFNVLTMLAFTTQVVNVAFGGLGIIPGSVIIFVYLYWMSESEWPRITYKRRHAQIDYTPRRDGRKET